MALTYFYADAAEPEAETEEAGRAAAAAGVPPPAPQEVTARLKIPTIGIGSGPYCDGQVLVSYDLLGLTSKTPPFVRKYAKLDQAVLDAAKAFIKDINDDIAGDSKDVKGA